MTGADPGMAQPICSGQVLGQVPDSPSHISWLFINRYCHSTTSALCFYPATELWKPLGVFLRSALKAGIQARSFLWSRIASSPFCLNVLIYPTKF